MYASRYRRLPVAVAAIALALSLTLTHVSWVCMDGRPCAFDCSHGIATPVSQSAGASHSHACCSHSANPNSDDAHVAADMTCRAVSASRVVVSAESLTMPDMPVGTQPDLPITLVAAADSSGFAAEHEGPPSQAVSRRSAPRAPPIAS